MNNEQLMLRGLCPRFFNYFLFFTKILCYALQFLKEFLPFRASFAAYAAAPRAGDPRCII